MNLNHIFIASIPITASLTLVWLLVSTLIKTQKKPAQLFLAGCTIMSAFLVHGYFMGSKIDAIQFVPIATVGINLTLILFKRALIHLVQKTNSTKEDTVLALSTVLVGTYMYFLPAPSYLSSILMASIASFLLIRSVVEVSNNVKEEFGYKINLLVTIPLAVFGCIYAMIGIEIMANPMISDFAVADKTSMIILVAITCGSLIPLNLGFFALMIVRVLEDAQKLSMQDNLTGLANRRQIEMVLSLENIRAKRSKKSFSVLLLDLDNFKSINEKMGQVVGDEVIIAIARILKETARVADTVGRAGGEEFIVILPDADLHGAEIAAERFRKAVSGLNLMINRIQVKTTASIGVVDQQGTEVVADILRMADRALHQAKATGKNKHVVFDKNAIWANDPIAGRSHHKALSSENPYFTKQSTANLTGHEPIQESINDILLRS